MTSRTAYLLAVLLLVGVQLAMSKSVEKINKDEQLKGNHDLIKRNDNKVTKEDEATSVEPMSSTPDDDEEEIVETTAAPVVTTPKPKKMRRRRPTTTTTTAAPTTASPYEYEDEEEEEEEPVAEDSKIAKTPKPIDTPMFSDRLKPDNSVPEPATGNPSLINPAKRPVNGIFTIVPINLPPAQPFVIHAFHDGFYEYPIPTGPAFSDNKAASGAVASASASAGGSGGFVSTSTSPGSSSSSSVSSSGGPALGKFGPNVSASRSGFPVSSSSAHGSGNNGVKFSTSAFPGGSSASVSSSSSFPGGAGGSAAYPNGVGASVSFPSRFGGTPQYSSEKVPGGQIDKVLSDSFVGVRGSFGSDQDSVGIEVNGPVAGAPGAGVPDFGGAGVNYDSTVSPGYSGGPAYGNTPYVNPYYNTIPYNPYNPMNFQNTFQQYLANLQAQQFAFQQQIQAQIQAQQQSGGTFASGGAFITSDQGTPDPNAQVYVNTYSSPNYASSATSINSRSGFGGAKSTVYTSPFENKDNNNRIWDRINYVDSYFGNPSGGSFPDGSISTGPQTASASASLGPNGGYQAGQISPVAPGIFSRFGESIPAPSGNSYGVFSSSSSSSMTGPDGKPINHKQATIGVNDNGKVTFQSVHDP